MKLPHLSDALVATSRRAHYTVDEILIGTFKCTTFFTMRYTLILTSEKLLPFSSHEIHLFARSAPIACGCSKPEIRISWPNSVNALYHNCPGLLARVLWMQSFYWRCRLDTASRYVKFVSLFRHSPWMPLEPTGIDSLLVAFSTPSISRGMYFYLATVKAMGTSDINCTVCVTEIIHQCELLGTNIHH